jgi:PAS domain S-box-containing protein
MFTLYAWTPKVPEKYIVSFGIIFWSIYNSNLPFRSDYLPVVISNYALGLCLLNTMVILLLIIHFKKGRFQIARQEAHYRMLVENAAGAVLLYNHGEMRFQYVSPSVLEETGHSAEELTRDPFALLQGLAGDAVEQVRRLLKAPPREAINLIYSRETVSGQTDWYELHASPVLDNAAFPVGVECVISNITDRMKLLDDLKRSEEARKNLIEDVSHELRTPITIIQGYTETLLDETPPDMNNVYLEIIHAKTQTLNTLLEDLIQASNFSSQQVEYKFYEILALEYFNRALNENRLRLEQEGRFVCCQNNLPEGLVVVIDHYRIDQVIANLLSNALKFTVTGDTISMYCDMNIEPATPEPQADSASADLRFDLPPGKIIVRISDTGRGIPPESLPHIFKRKYTGTNQPHDNGFGLGLYISREIIRQHGGQIWAENNPDYGASLYFSLPCYFKGVSLDG